MVGPQFGLMLYGAAMVERRGVGRGDEQ